MTKYTVVWRNSAVQELSQIWLHSTKRNEVTRSSDAIDKTLTYDPMDRGRDYFGDRYLIVHPLWVVYRIENADRIVEVLQVGLV